MSENFYHSELFRWSRDFSHRGFCVPGPCEHIGRAINRSCGDDVSLQLTMTDGKISTARYEGESCAISVATSGALCKMIEGCTPMEASVLFDALKKTVIEGLSGGEMEDFLILHQHVRRHKCATLIVDAWENIFQKL